MINQEVKFRKFTAYKQYLFRLIAGAARIPDAPAPPEEPEPTAPEPPLPASPQRPPGSASLAFPQRRQASAEKPFPSPPRSPAAAPKASTPSSSAAAPKASTASSSAAAPKAFFRLAVSRGHVVCHQIRPTERAPEWVRRVWDHVLEHNPKNRWTTAQIRGDRGAKELIRYGLD